jgi:hypothetical protein
MLGIPWMHFIDSTLLCGDPRTSLRSLKTQTRTCCNTNGCIQANLRRLGHYRFHPSLGASNGAALSDQMVSEELQPLYAAYDYPVFSF